MFNRFADIYTFFFCPTELPSFVELARAFVSALFWLIYSVVSLPQNWAVFFFIISFETHISLLTGANYGTNWDRFSSATYLPRETHLSGYFSGDGCLLRMCARRSNRQRRCLPHANILAAAVHIVRTEAHRISFANIASIFILTEERPQGLLLGKVALIQTQPEANMSQGLFSVKLLWKNCIACMFRQPRSWHMLTGDPSLSCR